MINNNNFILAKNNSYYFGIELSSFLSSQTQNMEPGQYLNYLRKSNLEFLNSIINPADSKLTFDFRIIFNPASAFNMILIVFLVRYNVDNKDLALKYLASFENLLQTYFPYLNTEKLTSEKIDYCLKPFNINSIYETKRRLDIVNLDTLKLSNKSEISEQSIVHTYRYIPSFESYDRLIRILYDENVPLIISCMLRPTSLTNNFIEFFEKQIARCEKYAQIGLSSSGDINSLFPTLREQAKLYQNELLKFYYGLKDNSAILQVRFASPSPLSFLLIESFNNLITEPAGSYSQFDNNQVNTYFRGGYITEKLVGVRETKNIKSISDLEITINIDKMLGKKLSKVRYLFDSNESASAFKPPFFIEDNIPLVNINKYKSYEIPFDYSATGVVVGLGIRNNEKEKIRISDEDRKRHMYVVGQTGTGKTTLLKQMIVSDMEDGKGLCLLDPHGDLFIEVLSKIPQERIDDVVIIDPNDTDYPVGMNILECTDYSQSYFIAQEMVDIITKLLIDEYGESSVGEFAGPVFFHHMKMNLLLTMSDISNPGTLLEFYQIFNNKDYWKKWLPLKVQDPILSKWTEKVLPLIDYTRPYNDGGSMGGYVSSKFLSFIFDPKLRNIFAQKKSTINFKKIMDEGKIVLVNLAKGELTESASRFFGMVILAKIQAELMQRLSTPPEQRRNFNLYVDEFQSIATKNFISLLSEGRKFGISLVLSNQFLFQVNHSIINSIFGNCGTIICFRLGMEDAETVEKKFYPSFNSIDLMNLPNWTACISTIERGQITAPFTLETIISTTQWNKKLSENVIRNSRKKYSSNKSDVEKIVSESM